jgi:hypothetical protein
MLALDRINSQKSFDWMAYFRSTTENATFKFPVEQPAKGKRGPCLS